MTFRAQMLLALPSSPTCSLAHVLPASQASWCFASNPVLILPLAASPNRPSASKPAVPLYWLNSGLLLWWDLPWPPPLFLTPLPHFFHSIIFINWFPYLLPVACTLFIDFRIYHLCVLPSLTDFLIYFCVSPCPGPECQLLSCLLQCPPHQGNDRTSIKIRWFNQLVNQSMKTKDQRQVFCVGWGMGSSVQDTEVKLR